jgi:hypothetical protein
MLGMSGDQGTEAGLGALQAGAAMYGGPYGMAAAAVIGYEKEENEQTSRCHETP